MGSVSIAAILILMTEFSQKYCLVQFLEPIDDGFIFSTEDWPLHSTIAGVFAFDRSRYGNDFNEMITRQSSTGSRTTEPAFFGANSEVPVMLIERTEEIELLHKNIVDFILSHDGSFNEPHYLYGDFLPHVTIHGSALAPDTPVPFNTLSLIDMFPNNDANMRQVLTTVCLVN